MDESVVGGRVVSWSFVHAMDGAGESDEIVGSGSMFFGNEFGFSASGFEKNVSGDKWPIEVAMLQCSVARHEILSLVKVNGMVVKWW